MSIKVKSPWTALQSIKTQLRDTEMNFTTLFSSLTGGEDSSIDNTYIGGSSNVYGVVHTVNTDQYILTSKIFDDINNTYLPEVTKTFNSRDDLLDGFINSGVSGQDIEVSSILIDIKQGLDANSVIADICNAFQSSQSMSISDLYSIINTSSLIDEDKRKIGGYLQSCLSNGKANSYGWLSILEKVFAEGYRTTDNGSIQMDKSSPFCIQPIVATVLSAVQTIISSIALLIKNAFSAVLMAVSFVVGFFANYVNKVASNTVNVDFNSSTWYLKGPVKYCDEYNTQRSRYGSADVAPIYLDHFGPFDIYSWPKNNIVEENVGKYSVNAFVTIGFDVIKAIAYFKEHCIYMYQDENANSTFDFYFTGTQDKILGLNWKDYFYESEEFYLTQDECLAILADPDKCAIYLMLLLQFDLLLNYSFANWYNNGVITYSATYKKFYNNQSGTYPLLDLKYTLPYERNSNGSVALGFLGLFGPWFLYEPLGVNHCIPNLTDGDWVSHSQAVEWLQDYFNYVVTPYAEEGANSGGRVVSLSNNPPQGYALLHLNDILYGSWSSSVNTTPCETIPTERAITIPDITMDKLVAIVTIVVSVIAALVVARTITNRIFRKRFTAKRLNDAREMNKLRREYEADPSNIDKYNAYYKTLRRYNLKAKLLGWNTYDPVNNWFDHPDAGASAMMASQSNPTILHDILTTDGKVSNIITSNIPALQSNINDNVNDTSSRIYSAITGHSPDQATRR